MTDDVIQAAAYYRSFGWQPLPSRHDAKRPWCCYARYWKRKYPIRDFEGMVRSRTKEFGWTNLQLMCGSHWGLCCIDLDGLPGIEAWKAMARFREDPPTWRVESYGADGLRGVHLFYSIPRGDDYLPTRRLWGIWDADMPRGDGKTGDWAARAAIEIKGEHSLMIAPPSRHPKPGCSYHVVAGFDRNPPAPLPDWVRSLPACRPPARAAEYLEPPPQRPYVPLKPLQEHGYAYDWSEVLRSIPSKVAEARTWGSRGLQFTGRLRGEDAWECRAFERAEDNDPSAILNDRTGRYWSPWIKGDGHGIGFFDLALQRGVFGSFHEAVHQLGNRYVARSRKRA